MLLHETVELLFSAIAAPFNESFKLLLAIAKSGNILARQSCEAA